MRRIFLGWDRPLLHAAADFFVQKFAKDGRLDMSRVVLALPGRRAYNRLEEILLERVERDLDPDWYPPEFLTLGTLPERFYELKRPIADDLTQRLAWIRVVDRMEDDRPELLARLLPHPPERSDLEARLALGKMFATLHRELAADGLDFKGVVRLCRQLKLEDEAARWDVLARLQEQYLRLLDELGVWDLQTARLFAIDNQEEAEHRRIVDALTSEGREFFLVGLVDLNRAQKRILDKYPAFVTSLVFAPETSADRFDEFGCLVPDRWADVDIFVSDTQIAIVESPEKQADAVLRTVAGFDGRFAAGEIVVGVPDPQVIPYLERRFGQADILTRHFEGTPTRRTSMYRFLEVLLDFIETKTFRSAAELARHPEVEDAVRRQETKSDGGTETGLLSELDLYYNEFLPVHVDGVWKSRIDEDDARFNRSFPLLETFWKTLGELLGEDVSASRTSSSREALPLQARKIETMLRKLYSESEDRTDRETLRQVQEALRSLSSVAGDLLTDLSLAETLRLVLMLLRSGNVPPHEKSNAVELIGWLEIVMDDAPVAIVTGMNDGFVPSFLTSDIFLPDKVRRRLGIEDNRRRFARDAYSLSVIRETRDPELVYLIGGRRSCEGDPMLPSRLFFSTDDETVARRVQRFFRPQPEEKELILTGTIRPGQAKTAAFKVPEPEAPPEPVRTMRVTEFADYLRCPYRYYLKNRLNLETLDDAAEELDGGAFGSLVHELLKRFGRSEVRNATSPETIRAYFETETAKYVRIRFGDDSRPSIAIQAERALERLKTFAFWQAEWRRSGRAILETEFAFNERSADGRIHLDVDGRKMFLRGRIDRIDVDEKTGDLFVLDYKTSDAATEPEKTHRKKGPEGDVRWIDFQLPLYRHILERAGYKETIALGYVALPKDVSKIGEQLATWTEDEIREAVRQAEDIVRRIWRNDFIKVDPPPKYSDAFAAICLDNVVK